MSLAKPVEPRVHEDVTGQKAQPLRILFLTSIFHIGGAERTVYDLIKHIDKREFEPILCTFYEPGPMGEIFASEGFPIYSLFFESRFDVRGLFRLRKLVLENDVSLIYLIVQPVTLLWGTLLRKICRVPIIAVVQNTPVGPTDFKVRTYRVLMRFVDRIVAVAETQKQHLIESEKLREDLISVIHNSVDTDRFKRRSERDQKLVSLGLDPEQKVVGTVTRLYSEKGTDIFLQAAAEVLRRFPAVKFVIVGDGPERPELKSLAHSLQIDGQVCFLGVRQDVHELVGMFDIAVLSSRTEALPLAVLEYMAAGRPIVASRVGSVPEIIEHGVTGLLAEPEQAEDFANQICHLLNDAKVASRLGSSARRRVESQFSLRESVRRTEGLIREVVGVD